MSLLKIYMKKTKDATTLTHWKTTKKVTFLSPCAVLLPLQTKDAAESDRFLSIFSWIYIIQWISPFGKIRFVKVKTLFLTCRKKTALYQTTEIRNFFEQIKDNVKVVKGLEKTFYGATEFSIEDNNGYLLTFAEDEK